MRRLSLAFLAVIVLTLLFLLGCQGGPSLEDAAVEYREQQAANQVELAAAKAREEAARAAAVEARVEAEHAAAAAEAEASAAHAQGNEQAAAVAEAEARAARAEAAAQAAREAQAQTSLEVAAQIEAALTRVDAVVSGLTRPTPAGGVELDPRGALTTIGGMVGGPAGAWIAVLGSLAWGVYERASKKNQVRAATADSVSIIKGLDSLAATKPELNKALTDNWAQVEAFMTTKAKELTNAHSVT